MMALALSQEEMWQKLVHSGDWSKRNRHAQNCRSHLLEIAVAAQFYSDELGNAGEELVLFRQNF